MECTTVTNIFCPVSIAIILEYKSKSYYKPHQRDGYRYVAEFQTSESLYIRDMFLPILKFNTDCFFTNLGTVCGHEQNLSKPLQVHDHYPCCIYS